MTKRSFLLVRRLSITYLSVRVDCGPLIGFSWSVFVNRSQKNRVLVYSNGPLILSPRFPSIPRHVDEQSHRARSAPTQICSSKVRSTRVFYSQRASSELERSCDRLRKLAKTPATSPASRARDKDWFSSRNTPKMTPQPAPDVQTGGEEGDKSRSASSEPCPVPMFPCSQSRFLKSFQLQQHRPGSPRLKARPLTYFLFLHSVMEMEKGNA